MKILPYLLGAFMGIIGWNLGQIYYPNHETKCEKNYRLYSDYMYMINVDAQENGFGKQSLYTKEEFCKYASWIISKRVKINQQID